MTATVTARPSSLVAPGFVDLYLSGFAKGERVTIAVDSLVVSSGVRVGSDGTLSKTGVPVASGAVVGSHPVVVTKWRSTTVRARTSFSVTAPIPGPEPTPDPVPTPDPTPTPGPIVTVKTLADLKAALLNNEANIVLAPNAYKGPLIIDSQFAVRTAPGIIDCTGATIDGGGGTNTASLWHHGGVHDLDWRGLVFANGVLNQTGVLMFDALDEPGVFNISIRKAKILSNVKRALLNNTSEHGAYFSHSQNGGHDILIEDFDVDASSADGLATGIHMDHADLLPNGHQLVNSHHVTVRRLTFKGNGTQGPSVQYPIILWVPAVHDWLIDGATISDANGNPVRYESRGGKNNVFRNIVSVRSRYPGANISPMSSGYVDDGGNSFG